MPSAVNPVFDAAVRAETTGNVLSTLSGRDARKAAEEAAGQQVSAGEDALSFSREQLAPFQQAGAGALGELTNFSNVSPSDLTGLNQASQGPAGQFQSNEFTAPQNNLTAPQFGGFEFDTDPNRVLQNPLFQQAAQQQEQRLINQNAALGLGASGQTRRDLFANNASLANQFLQQDIGRQQQTFQNQQQGIQQQFANQFGLTGRDFQQQFATSGQNFQNSLAARQQNASEQQQRFGNIFDINQLGFNQSLAANQNRFNQRFEVARLGSNAASQQATSGANILQGIGNARSAGTIGAANANQQGLGNLISLAGLFGGFSDIRLKDNIEYYDTTADGVHIYSWEWNEEGKRLAGDQVEFGPIAQELRETHPENVVMGEDGYLMLVELEEVAQ